MMADPVAPVFCELLERFLAGKDQEEYKNEE